jgi:hypothetical protein
MKDHTNLEKEIAILGKGCGRYNYLIGYSNESETWHIWRGKSDRLLGAKLEYWTDAPTVVEAMTLVAKEF